MKKYARPASTSNKYYLVPAIVPADEETTLYIFMKPTFLRVHSKIEKFASTFFPLQPSPPLVHFLYLITQFAVA